MSTLKVNTIRHTGASSDAVTLATDGTCTAKITNNLSNRNLIINGAFQVAQRGTSSTNDGIHTVDRFTMGYGGENEALTQAQHALTSSDTGPWEKGFRKSFHITNGNQTGGAGVTDYVFVRQKVEAQNMANSGWDYTSASSYITFSFWVKASVAQDYQGWLYTSDGTAQGYAFTFALSANTWTKVTKTIPGNSNIQFDDNNGAGLEVVWQPFVGTDYTSSSGGAETWGAWNGYTTRKDMTSTWWTTNDATFEITGVQLEVGDVATDFEHRSYGDELQRCKRYYTVYAEGADHYVGSTSFQYNSSIVITPFKFDPEMRDTPTLDSVTGTNYYTFYEGGSGDNFNGWDGVNGIDTKGGCVNVARSGTAGDVGAIYCNNSSSKIAFVAEL